MFFYFVLMKLIFVYNAKSDRLNKMIDFAHKIVRPSTYNCDLCSLTHGNFNEHENWSSFRKKSEIEMEFYHIEDFEEKFKVKAEYPIIFRKDETELSPLLERDEIAEFETTDQLIEKIKSFI